MSDPTESEMVQVNVWMSPELRDELDALTAQLDVNRSQLVRRACRELILRLSIRLTNMSDGAIAEVTE